MNTEKAIEEIISYMHSDAYCDAPSNEACTVAVAALREKLEREKNEPLTIEELRKMDGEPVWIVGVSSINHFRGHWDICDWENGEVILFPHCMETPDKELYGISWLAYRHPLNGQEPKEEQHGGH